MWTLLTCHSNTAPTVLRHMRQMVNQPNDLYLRKLGLEPGSMHSPRSQVQYSYRLHHTGPVNWLVLLNFTSFHTVVRPVPCEQAFHSAIRPVPCKQEFHSAVWPVPCEQDIFF